MVDHATVGWHSEILSVGQEYGVGGFSPIQGPNANGAASSKNQGTKFTTPTRRMMPNNPTITHSQNPILDSFFFPISFLVCFIRR